MAAKHLRFFWALPFCLLLLVSCESKSPLGWEDVEMPLPPGSETNLEEIERQWEIWRSWNLDSYQLLYRQWCFCGAGGRLVLVRVQDGDLRDVRAVDGRPDTPATSELRPTVDWIFEAVQRALEHEPDLLLVHYDPTFGYPDHIEINYSFSAIDDEVRVQALLVVPGPLDW